jgi:CMP-N,N'-diacetyllegionaminic acid synthase
VLVTTDTEEIATISRRYGAQAPFLRPAELASDTAAKIPVLRHALQQAEQITGRPFDVVIDLQPTSPIRKLSDLDAALSLFLEKKPKTILSVVPCQDNPYFNLLEPDAQGFVRISKSLGKPLTRRQDAPRVYAANGSIYVYDRNYLLDPQSISAVSDQTLPYVMDEITGVDVDREIDFKLLEFLSKEGLVSL